MSRLAKPKPKMKGIYKFAAVVLVINALVCVDSLKRMKQNIEYVVATREAVATIDRTETSLQDAEMGVRTFMLTENPRDFAKFGKTINKVDLVLDDLARRAKNDPLFETRVASLKHVVGERTEKLWEVARIWEKQGRESAAVVLNASRGQKAISEISRIVEEIRNEENTRLLAAKESARLAIEKTSNTLLIASLLALFLLVVVYYVNRREIARRERAAAEVREREEWFSATLASISDAVIATDKAGRVRLINPVAQRLTGWGFAESKGKSLDEVFPLLSEESRVPIASPVSRILSEGVSVGLTNHTLLVARDGTEHPVEHSGAPIRDRNGAITGIVLCFRDIADRQRAEIELRASKESADAANRAKDQFLAVLSHELRKPLTPVLMAVSGMLDQEPEPSDELRPTLEMIRRNIDMESRLIDDLLDVSRIARGGLRLHTGIVDVHEIIRQTVAMCHAETLYANLDVVLELSARRHHALGDETRLMQVFSNLITNSAKFTNDGGRLEIQTWDEDPADRSQQGRRLIIECRDTGIGIDPESLDRIFEPFEQGDGTFRKHYGGLGLGLAISRGIVEAHGGRMAAHSPGRGQGSTFRMELPVVAAPALVLPESEPSAGSRPAQHLRLLLVEDNPDTLRYLALVLGQRGHEVKTADTLAAARHLLAEESGTFDLLISDIELPDGSGLELMRDTDGLSGIALSGFGSDEDVRMSKSAGFSRHLIKPIDIRILEEAILQVASRRVHTG